ncbi:MAG: hypothetical protein EAY65_01555 [Alphaproteobacteria bacterium]|nr:MAG: hypothetical protein EAY65_01555 [Alphaproteobacteria bacterium]
MANKSQNVEYQGVDELLVGNAISQRYSLIANTVLMGVSIASVMELIHRNVPALERIGEIALSGAAAVAEKYHNISQNTSVIHPKDIAGLVGRQLGMEAEAIADVSFKGNSTPMNVIVGAALVAAVVAPMVGFSVGAKQAHMMRENHYQMQSRIHELEAEIANLTDVQHQGRVQETEVQKAL